MIYDKHGAALMESAKRYLLANDPTAELTHAMVDAFLRLIAERSGLAVTMRVGAGQITRKPE